MEIVLDVNSFISALIKDSLSRKIIKNSGLNFYFPERAFKKIIKYKDYILEKSGLSEEEFVIVVSVLFNYLQIVSDEDLEKYMTKAKKVFEKIDEEDVLFVACALYLKGKDENAAIWSDDRHFDKQSIVPILKTKDLLSYGLEL